MSIRGVFGEELGDTALVVLRMASSSLGPRDQVRLTVLRRQLGLPTR